MSVKIEIYGETAAEAMREIFDIGRSMGLSPTDTRIPASVLSDLSSDAQPKPAAEPKAEKPKAARKAADRAPIAAPADPAPEVQAQDAADEQAESTAAVEKAAEKAKVDPAEVFTRDTLRTAGGDYAKVYGMPATLEDGPKIIGYPSFGKVPDAEIEKATRAMRAAIEQNPFDRAPETAAA